jgi:hypothetical protein
MDYFCEFCEVDCGNIANYGAHVTGKRHMKKLEAATATLPKPAVNHMVHFDCDLDFWDDVPTPLPAPIPPTPKPKPAPAKAPLPPTRKPLPAKAPIPATPKPLPAKALQSRSIWDALAAHRPPIPEFDSSLPTPIPEPQTPLPAPTTLMVRPPSSPIQDALAYYEARREASTPPLPMIPQKRHSPPPKDTVAQAREAYRWANVEADNAKAPEPMVSQSPLKYVN